MDNLTVQALVFAEKFDDSDLRTKISDMDKKERFLDKAPDKYVPMSRGIETEAFGIYMRYRRLYAHYMQDYVNTGCRLVIDGREVRCDTKVYVALKVLLDVGISKSEECAMACREIFGAMLSRETVDGITSKEVSKALRLTGDYYKNEIIKAITDSIYSPEEQVKIALRGALKEDDVDYAYDLLGQPVDKEDMEDTIRRVYKESCLDQNFHVKKHLGRTVGAIRYLQEKQRRG